MLDTYSRWLWAGVMALALWSPMAGLADAKHPLEPLDLSSPRATMNTFLTTGDAFYSGLRDEYWHAPSRADVDRLVEFNAELQSMLDLSDVPPTARFELGRDGTIHLYEVLSRIELPPETDIPDAAYADAGDEKEDSDRKQTVSWTIPHTDITLVRVSEGPRAGEFLFSSATVARAEEFYKKTRTLPYRRDVPLENYADMRPYLSMTGWMISSRTIEGFPDWLKRSVYGQAVWKWIVLAMLIAVTAVVIVVIHRLARRGLSGHAAGAHLRRLVTPLALLLTPLVLYLANRQLTLTDWVSGGVTLVAEAVGYFALAWITWTGSITVAEAVIASSKIPDQSLHAQLLRLAARTVGIVGAIAIIFYISNRLGAPLYGLVAGLGVGGLAVALAARPTLENFIAAMTLYVDRPVRVGQWCQFQDVVGAVERIGLRSTRIRRWDGNLISVPNSQFAEYKLDNYDDVRDIFIRRQLHLRLDTTPEQLRDLLGRLREMLAANPKVKWPDIRLSDFGESFLVVELRCYAETSSWSEFRAIREDVLLRVMEIIREAGSALAIPAQATYFARAEGFDEERQRALEEQVKEWSETGELPRT